MSPAPVIKEFMGNEVSNNPDDSKGPTDAEGRGLDSTGMPTVFYDGSCPLCQREINFYRNMAGAGNITWHDVTASSPGDPTAGLSRDNALKRFHVKTAEGELLSGAAAFAHLWSSLPGWRLLGAITVHPVMLPFAEGAYRLFLLARPALQALVRKFEDGQSSSSK